MECRFKGEITGWAVFIGAVFILAAVGTFYKVPYFDMLRAIFGAVYVLFLPGYVVVRCFFNDLEDWIEKAAVSFGLSIAVVVLSMIVANLVFRIPLTPLSTLLIILAAMIITVLAKLFSEKKLGKSLKNKHK